MNPGIKRLLIRDVGANFIRSAALVLICMLVVMVGNLPGRAVAMKLTNESIELPAPRQDSKTSVEHALLKRRSVRDLSSEAISLAELSQLLWAAQGTSNDIGFRTAPSAGALYPLQLYVAVGNVTNLPQGVYRYQSTGHRLIRVSEKDKRKDMASAALGQKWVKNNAVLVVFTADESRVTRKYGQRGLRYVQIEVGHAAQNLFLQAQALDLDAAVVGAFSDKYVKEILDLPKKQRPLYLMPVGKQKK